MVSSTIDYISVGGNRHPSAADWDIESGVLAFGADNNIAIWNPADRYHKGVYALLQGHTSPVNAVKFYSNPSTGSRLLLSGSSDRTIRVWKPDTASPPGFTLAATLEGHENSINTIAVAESSDVFASGAADGTVRTWRVTGANDSEGGLEGSLVETISLKPRCFPLDLALKALPSQNQAQPMVLTVGGTRTVIQIYVSQDVSEEPQFKLACTLTGHEAWIRSLAFAPSKEPQSQDFLLASASQDKYIRLWRVCAGEGLPASRANADEAMLGTFGQTLSNKAHVFEANTTKYSITFEALLFGHEDWIYTVSWNSDPSKPRLLSSSADNSLVIWEPDPVSGAWFSGARMGEISAQKGSTTATGSAGGFWMGLWSPNGDTVLSLGRTGSWRSWGYDGDADTWVQKPGISGHVKSVNGIEWEPSGGYLLSTSSDQTTRLHASWKQDSHHSWQEFSRPQIHGYDLNCIATLGPSRFVSGADEKLLRVFNETRAISKLLEKLSGFDRTSEEQLSETANIPVLGLSNKAMDDDEPDIEGLTKGVQDLDTTASAQVSSISLEYPPLEDHLARHTLWPEHEKLYGHGYEISAVAATHDCSLIATACKASSIDHAVIRLYDTTTWNEIRPPLTAHSLTITCLRFSADDQYLLSVGRDRQWAVFERDQTDKALFRLHSSNPKGHSRMILGASWAPYSSTVTFATAGRDKNVKIWALEEKTFACKATIPLSSPVTAIDFLPTVVNRNMYLAVGEDMGQISIHRITADTLETGNPEHIARLDCPSKSVMQLSWRPSQDGGQSNDWLSKENVFQLAVASEDSSVRIYNISNLPP